MKTTGGRAGILYLMIIGFFVGLGVFLYGFVLDGGSWAMQPFNKYASGNSQLTTAGDVLDRKGVVLAKSENGKRVYSSDETIRRSMLHAVGDTNGYISTGVQYRFRTEIGGYNPITGLTSPTGKKQGSDISLTLSSELSKIAYNKLGDRNGAVAMYNYKTGEMLVMVSKPDFDPANVPKDIDTNTKYNGAYLNKVLSASYTPGSIFKVITTAAAIENLSDWDTRTFQCKGSVTINGNKITCDGVHGTVNVKQALAKSCNVAFAQLAVELGEDKMTAEANTMGFNRSFSVDGVDTSKSKYEVKGAEKQALAWSGIGQHTDMTNPYHMMLLMGAIANGGTPTQPYLIQQVKNSLGMTQQQGKTQLGTALVNSSTAQTLQQLMRYNVTNDYGDDMFPGMSVCAKTGTAEVGGGKKPNGWMIGFSSDPKTPYAFAVVVEEGNYGRTSAGPIAKAIMTQAKKLAL
ncbi:MAG: penicillin-binding transpeptidase domain-containing protein [Clostridium sp.]|uniref:penicillin-binding transpeptidase domain-containing protein n=1 Tax=Clostridium sp. TaxID=1506 RepID=UPI002909DDAC|nr:penicillin-binding transpeptidase domain-containing protein [Clostridium sp.]MDU7336828.1 penicillin-binding transpeptidase domain-containing protein [Clostridium sp.]